MSRTRLERTLLHTEPALEQLALGRLNVEATRSRNWLGMHAGGE